MRNIWVNTTVRYLVLLGIITICIIVLYLKIQKLEYTQQLIAKLPSGTIQTMSGTLQTVTSDEYIYGNPHAPVTIIDYSDFECPECQQIHPTLTKLLNSYNGKVRLVLRMFPLPQNKNAQKEAEAALCAGKLGGNTLFWKYGNAIFDRTTGSYGGEGFPLKNLVPLAKELGLSEKNFQTCLDTGAFAKQVQQQELLGEQAGVKQLPTLFIIDRHGKALEVVGNQSYQTLHILITAALL